jgi:hypothetical protein
MIGLGCVTPHIIPELVAVPLSKPVVNVSVYISSEFTELEWVNIIAGIRLWETATHGLLTWQLKHYDESIKPVSSFGLKNGVIERSVLFKRVLSHEGWVKNWDRENHNTLLGLRESKSSSDVAVLWLVEDRLKTDTSEMIIAAHEFGHALGIDHVQDISSVMSEFYAGFVTGITSHDLTAFLKRYDCDYRLVNVSSR